MEKKYGVTQGMNKEYPWELQVKKSTADGITNTTVALFKRMDAAVFYVNVNIGIDEEVGDAAVNINLQVVQPAFLPRERDIVFGDATTWQNGCVFLCELSKITGVIESVKNRVDIFINDYLEANPKQTER